MAKVAGGMVNLPGASANVSASLASGDSVFAVLQRLTTEVQQLHSKLEQCSVVPSNNPSVHTAAPLSALPNLATVHTDASDLAHHYQQEVQ